MQVIEALKRLMPQARDDVERPARAVQDKGEARALASFKEDLAKRAEKNTRHIPGEWQSRRT
jgi:hypothetical protein